MSLLFDLSMNKKCEDIKALMSILSRNKPQQTLSLTSILLLCYSLSSCSSINSPTVTEAHTSSVVLESSSVEPVPENISAAKIGADKQAENQNSKKSNKHQQGKVAAAPTNNHAPPTNPLAETTALNHPNKTPPNTTDSEPEAEEISSIEKEALKIADSHYDAIPLLDLLIAEVAAHRKQPELTLGNYMRQAQHTRDPDVIARATQIARFMQAHQAALQMALLWAEVEPKSKTAHQVAALQLMQEDRYDDAVAHLDTLLNLEGKDKFRFFVHSSRTLEPKTKIKMLKILSQLTDTHPEVAEAWFAKALLEEQNNQFDAAITTLNETLKRDQNHIDAKILRGRLLFQAGKQKSALRHLKKACKQHREHKRLRVIYARMLVNANQYKKAQRQFSILVKQFPRDGELLLSLALISWENKMSTQAQSYLEKLIANGQHEVEARIYLGRISASQKNYPEAIQHYNAVPLGPHYASAKIQIALIQHDQGDSELALTTIRESRKRSPNDTEELYIAESELLLKSDNAAQALELLTKALQKSPDNSNLLYSRSMIAEKLDRLDILEKDLLSILAKSPNNPIALNALGYTLADRTTRYKEALHYISKALELEPDDAAVLDSMGWVMYRLGDHDMALKHLSKAYSQEKDHEIAAHYGEVLWVTGKQQEAEDVWQKALANAPHDTLIKKTMKRLMVP